MRLFQQGHETVEDGIELAFPSNESPCELRDGVGVALSKILAIEHACGVEGDVVPVFYGDVAIGGLGVGATGLDHLAHHLGLDVEFPSSNLRGQSLAKFEVPGGIGRLIGRA